MGFIKLNVDAALDNNKKKQDLGFVVRDCNSDYLAAASVPCHFLGPLSPLSLWQFMGACFSVDIGVIQNAGLTLIPLLP